MRTTTPRPARSALSDPGNGVVSARTPVDLSAAVANVRPVYEIPDHDLIGDVLIPGLAGATAVDIGVGFFTSHCLSQIAPGLVSLIDRHVKARLLVSPELSREDRDAIERGLRDPAAVIDSFMIELLREPNDALGAHAADCLAYLVANDTLDIRCVLMSRGMFHKKLWLLSDSTVMVAIHGSGNLTTRGLLVNGEQMTVDRPWMDGDSASQRVDDLAASFELEWNNKKPDRLTISPEQLLDLLRDRAETRQHVPTVEDFWNAWARDRDLGLAPPLPPGVAAPSAPRLLRVPDWLDYEHPPYDHQSLAIQKLADCDYTGLLAMATGGGKTKTALISCTRIQDEAAGPVFIMILVPTSVLATQWADEVTDFGVSPTVLSGMTPSARRQALEDFEVALRAGGQRTEIAIATLQLFNQGRELREFVEGIADDSTTILVADEAHNFGARGFISDPPEAFQHRIGLSATPVRQYDADGTAELFDFFRTYGEPAFTFTLGEAIKSGCLTPYNYFVHTVELDGDEMERYSELTEQLVKAGFAADDAEAGLSERQERLLRERRSLIEQASGKVTALHRELSTQRDDVAHTLIYCSAKAIVAPHSEKQIDLAREVLRSLRIDTHMYTSAETSRADSRVFLDGFAVGTYPVLLAMKVLDEGVDVPAARSAYLLASSTVEREWVQRRGRVLRKAPGKEAADLHDFVVLPPDPGETGARGLIQSELRRAQHFATDARNKYDRDGPIDTIRAIEGLL